MYTVWPCEMAVIPRATAGASITREYLVPETWNTRVQNIHMPYGCLLTWQYSSMALEAPGFLAFSMPIAFWKRSSASSNWPSATRQRAMPLSTCARQEQATPCDNVPQQFNVPYHQHERAQQQQQQHNRIRLT